MGLFGTGGIRGIVNKEHYPDFYLHLALSIGTIIRSKKMVMATDGRLSVPIVKNALASGLAATGHDIVDLGVLPTPALQYYCRERRLPGIMVTASHNPPAYSGIKLVMADGLEINRKKYRLIENLYKTADFKERKSKRRSEIAYATWDKVGVVSTDSSAKDLYINGILGEVNAEAIRKAGLKLLCDCTNGATAVVVGELLKRLNIRSILVNETLDGTFPGHGPEPSLENLRAIVELTKKKDIDFAVVFDPDGDRSIFLSPKGKYLDGNWSVPMIAASRLTKGDVVVAPVDTADTLAKTLQKVGAILYETKIGRNNIVREMVRTGARLGGDEYGHVAFRDHQLCADGMMTLALFSEIVATRGLKTMLEQMPSLTHKRINMQTPVRFEKIRQAMLKSIEHVDVNYLDGIKLRIDDDTWVMARPSGTEPLIRLCAQAKTEKSVDELLASCKAIIERV